MFICIAFALWNICETYIKTVVSLTVPHLKWLRTYIDSNIHAEMAVEWTVTQSSCIFSETIAGYRFKSPRIIM